MFHNLLDGDPIALPARLGITGRLTAPHLPHGRMGEQPAPNHGQRHRADLQEIPRQGVWGGNGGEEGNNLYQTHPLREAQGSSPLDYRQGAVWRVPDG